MQIFKKYINSPKFRLLPQEDFINNFTNLRQLNRWLNNLSLSYSVVGKECHIGDLADIEFLKLFYPTIYFLIAQSFEEFFIIKNGKVSLWNNDDDTSDKYQWMDEKHRNLYETKEYKDIKTEEEKENLKTIIERLLGGMFSKDEALRFATPGYSMRYFYGSLQDNEIAQKDFLKLIGMDSESMIKEIHDSHLDSANSLTLLCQTIEVDNPQKEENIIKMVFYLSSILDFYAFDTYKLMKRLEKIIDGKEERETLLLKYIESMPLSVWI